MISAIFNLPVEQLEILKQRCLPISKVLDYLNGKDLSNFLSNLINNAVFVGDRMKLRKEDILCSPPPLFHCFGLVLGLLATLTHGSSIVFPSESFNAKATLDAVLQEGCTALHGVPAMWIAEMSLVRRGDDFSKLRTGIAAGSATPRQMLEDLELKLHLLELTNTYGMSANKSYGSVKRLT